MANRNKQIIATNLVPGRCAETNLAEKADKNSIASLAFASERLCTEIPLTEGVNGNPYVHKVVSGILFGIVSGELQPEYGPTFVAGSHCLWSFGGS